MKKIFTILLLVSLFSCEQRNEKYSISHPTMEGQACCYHYTNKYKIDENDCITFREDTVDHKICGYYTINKRY